MMKDKGTGAQDASAEKQDSKAKAASDPAAHLASLQEQLEEASRSSKRGTIALSIGLILTLISAGLAAYTVFSLRAELEALRNVDQACIANPENCGAAIAAVEAEFGEDGDGQAGGILDVLSGDDDENSAAENPDSKDAEGSGNANQPGGGAEIDDTADGSPNNKPNDKPNDNTNDRPNSSGASQSTGGSSTVNTNGTDAASGCKINVLPIQFALCADRQLMATSRAFWRVFNERVSKASSAQKARLQSEQRRWLKSSVAACGLNERRPANPQKVRRALPCLNRAYMQRVNWAKRLNFQGDRTNGGASTATGADIKAVAVEAVPVVKRTPPPISRP